MIVAAPWQQAAQAATKELPASVYPKLDAIKRIMKLFLARNFDALEQASADSAFVRVQGPPELPYGGTYAGKTCVRDWMAKFNESFVIQSAPEVMYYVNPEGSAFVALDLVLETARERKVVLETTMTMKVKVDADSKLTKMAIISDTLSAYRALQDADNLYSVPYGSDN